MMMIIIIYFGAGLATTGGATGTGGVGGTLLPCNRSEKLRPLKRPLLSPEAVTGADATGRAGGATAPLEDAPKPKGPPKFNAGAPAAGPNGAPGDNLTKVTLLKFWFHIYFFIADRTIIRALFNKRN